MNLLMISGKVVSCPVVSNSENNKTVVKFSIENEEDNKTNRINVVAIDSPDESTNSSFCTKLDIGDYVMIVGHIRISEWRNEYQELQKFCQIVVNNIMFVDYSKKTIH